MAPISLSVIMIKKNHFLSLIFILSIQCITAQTNQRIGEWKDLLGFYSCNSVAHSNDYSTIYVSNRNSIAAYNKTTQEIESIYNKTTGLSDVGIKILRCSPLNNKLLVCYDNGNIDVLDNKQIYNVSDIKNSSIQGSKKINEITFVGKWAYIACGFGIILFDTDKLEIKETYFIGKNNTFMNVYQVAFDDSLIYAATDSSVYKANKNSILNDFRNWKPIPGNSIPKGTYSGVVNMNGKIYAAYSPFTRNTANWMQDTLYQFDASGWHKSTFVSVPNVFKKLYAENNIMWLKDAFGARGYDKNYNQIYAIASYAFGNSQISDIIIDYTTILPGHPIESYIADDFYGFIRTTWDQTIIKIDGTHGDLVSRIKAYNGNIIVAPSKIDETGNPNFYLEGPYYFDSESWHYLRDFNHDTIVDISDAVIDQNDNSHIYACSWINGIVEYQNNTLKSVHNFSNSGLINAQAVNLSWHLENSITKDKNGNIWVSHPITPSPFSVLKPNGQVQNYYLPGFNALMTGRLIYTKNDQLWVLLTRGNGILVYNNDGNTNLSSTNSKYLSSAIGNGNLPTDYVYSIAEDKNGYVWLGTTQGVAVIYNPENIFNGGNYDAQQIYVTQDGQTQLLLITEQINAITIDSADRKWIGTESSGLYCFTPDGQTQIYHFTTDNSPLISNRIIDIAYDEVTGDIIVGTDKGVQSYKTDVIKGYDEYTNVHAFPNPANRNTENIYIKGLIDGTIIKITDIAGNIVWEGKSAGGMITWNMYNLYNKKVTNGIYVVYASTSDNQQRAVTKIMILN